MYYLVFGLLYLVSLIPFWLLYLISDFAAFILRVVVRYRIKIVEDNLRIAFPEKTVAERKVIARRFYRNFTDNFLELVKLMSISKRTLLKRFPGDCTLMARYIAEGRNVQMLLGHTFNWEMGNPSYALQARCNFLVVYMPLSSKAMDRVIFFIRRRFGSLMLPATNFGPAYQAWSKEQYAICLVADQNPGNPRKAYWYPFFGKKAPFVKGPEREGRLSDNVALFSCFWQERRGYYRSKTTLITDHTATLTEGELTRRFVKCLEEAIREHPANYLWSHRRWKHDFDPAKHARLEI